MAPIWKGTISFGLVNIPVELAAAGRADNISFRMLDAETGSPVKYERVRASDGTPVPWAEIVKGFEYVKGQYIVLTDDDFKKAALESSKSIETPYLCCPVKEASGGMRCYARPCARVTSWVSARLSCVNTSFAGTIRECHRALGSPHTRC